MHTHTPHTHTPHATHTNTHTLWLSLDICIVCFQAEECMQTNREYKSYLCHNLCQFLISAVHSARHLASLPVLPRCTHITHSSLPRIGTEDTEWFHPVQGRTAQSDVTQYRTEWFHPVQGETAQSDVTQYRTEWFHPVQGQTAQSDVTQYRTEWFHPVHGQTAQSDVTQYRTEWFHPVQEQTAQSDVTQYRKREQSGVPQYKNRDQCVVLPNTRTDNTV